MHDGGWYVNLGDVGFWLANEIDSGLCYCLWKLASLWR